MFGLEALDMMIGLVTIYLTLALACTAIVEALAAGMNVRSKNLDIALKEFLAGKLREDQAFLRAFYTHPLVLALKKESYGIPSYIPPQVVGQVVYALITADDSSVPLKEAVARLPGTAKDNRIKGLLITLIDQVNENADEFRKAVEVHFDAAMDRASGWVKRHQQKVAFLVALTFVAIGNVDTFDLANKLSTNSEFRAKQVNAAEQLLNQQPTVFVPTVTTVSAGTSADSHPFESNKGTSPFQDVSAQIQQAIDNVNSDGLVFGWKKGKPDGPAYKAILEQLSVIKVLGLLITILAVSLGAPFWFDVLQRFMQVRQTGISPREKGAKEGTA